jgi:hypothetical protein
MRAAGFGACAAIDGGRFGALIRDRNTKSD